MERDEVCGMPVDDWTEEQAKRYGCSVGEPTREELTRSVHLVDADGALIAQRYGDHNRLGFGGRSAHSDSWESFSTIL